MKISYGFYLNRFLKEYDRIKTLNSIIYKDKIKRCYKTQNFIASELCACVENLMSSLDMFSGDTPTGDMFEKPKEGNKENNKNKINEEAQKNVNKINEDSENKIKDNKINDKNENKINENKIKENKINENKINEESNNNNKGDNKINNIEESGFNLIKNNDGKKE